MNKILVVPCDPLSPKKVDEHFADEATAALNKGWEVVRVDHDSLTHNWDFKVYGAGEANGTAVYRGWMVTTAQYAVMKDKLQEKGVSLAVSPEQFRKGNLLPSWYMHFTKDTPVSWWLPGYTIEDFAEAYDSGFFSGAEGPYVLRDYQKSMKHYWDEAMYIPDINDREAVMRVVSRFIELRGGQMVMGFVLREFENFGKPEVRTWWVNGELRLVTCHPDTPDDWVDRPYENYTTQFGKGVQSTRLPFVTLDIVRIKHGDLRVVELGDGQVSDRPSSFPAEYFFEDTLLGW